LPSQPKRVLEATTCRSQRPHMAAAQGLIHRSVDGSLTFFEPRGLDSRMTAL